jgi:hypothetical protein
MSAVIEELEDFVEEVFTSVEEGVEELFPPRPGGKVDSTRQEKIRAEAYQEHVSGQEKDSVIVKPKLKYQPAYPDTGSAVCVTLSSVNPSQRILPRDYDRRSAVILAIDNDVYLTNSSGLAADIAGTTGIVTNAYYLPAGIGIPWENTAALYASATTTGTSSRISVIINKDSA